MSDNMIQGIDIEITATIEKAASALNKLNGSLKRISTTLSDKGAMERYGSSINAFAKACSKSINKLERLGDAFEKIKQNSSGLISAAHQVSKATAAMSEAVTLPPVQIEQNTSGPEVLSAVPVETESIKEAQATISKAQEGTKQLTDAHNKLHKSVNKSTSGFGKFLKSVGRIALYRAIRSAISAITNAMKEGEKNLREYSKAMANTDSLKASKTLDQLDASALKVKNTLGVSFTSVLVSLKPLLDRIAASIINAANAMNQFLAAMDGRDTYTRATGYVSNYTEETKEAVKATNKMLQSFDELNNISTPSAGSAAVASVPSYEQMFEEAAVDASAVKQFEKILGYAEDIALVIAGWKIASSIVDWAQVFNLKDAEGHLTELGNKVSKTLAGAAVALIQFKVTKDSISNIMSGEGTFMDWLGAGLATVVGTGLQVALFGSTGFVISGITLALSFTVALFENMFDEDPYGFKAVQKSFQEKIDKSLETSEAIKVNIGNLDLEYEVSTRSLDKVKEMVDELFDINEKASLSQTDLGKISNYVNTINGLNIQGLQLELDPNGRVKQTREDVEAIVDGLINAAKLNAAQDKLSKAYDDLLTADDNLKNMEKTRDDILLSLAHAEEQSQKDYWRYMNLPASDGNGNAIRDNIERGEILYEGYGVWELEAESLRKQLEDAEKAVQKAKDSYDEASASVEKWSGKIGELNGTLDTSKGVVQKTKDEVKKLSDEIKSLPTKKRVEIELEAKGSGSKGATVNLSFSKYTNTIQTKANGGFISAGQLFVAREAGPEMVGTIGGHTAVANNEQIVSAIANGVYKAMMSANGSRNVNVTLEGDASKLFRVIRNSANDYTRGTGTPAFI